MDAPAALPGPCCNPERSGRLDPSSWRSERRSEPWPITPDGRYLVVRGRLWRRSNPNLAEAERQRLVDALMTARRAVGRALRAGDAEALRRARADVDAAKHGLGERGPVWWTDGAPDLNRRLARNTPYADWWGEIVAEPQSARRASRAAASG